MLTTGYTDEQQLAIATEQQRVFYTFNVGDFCQLHSYYIANQKTHTGIVISSQEYSVGEQMRRTLMIKCKSLTLSPESVLSRYLKIQVYESIGIEEYWIADYLGIGGRRYIGSPKRPTLSVCTLVDEEYEIQQFKNDDLIRSSKARCRRQSRTFPELQLTVDQLFNSF